MRTIKESVAAISMLFVLLRLQDRQKVAVTRLELTDTRMPAIHPFRLAKMMQSGSPTINNSSDFQTPSRKKPMRFAVNISLDSPRCALIAIKSIEANIVR